MTSPSIRTCLSVQLCGLACAVFGGRLLLAAQTGDGVEFLNVAREAKLDFVHDNGATPDKFLPETMSGGALLFDYDNDGWLDAFFVNGGSFVDPEAASQARHRLYRNNADLTFTETTGTAGIGVSGYGMGACSADYDNDGWADLYITSVGPNRLYRNTGNGRFEDVTASAGVGFGDWSVSCAFADVDNDGHLDLYVVNYLDFDPGNNKYCGTAALDVRTYCAPSVYNAVSDVLYRNRGDGTFSDASRQARIDSTAGKGLGVVFSDYDADGWVDMYVANDSVANFLFRNRGGGVFDEVGLLAGVAVGPGGRPQGGMGADIADADGDQRMDVFVTNLDREMHSLYRQLDGGLFEDATSRSNLGLATLPFVGFGTAFLDFDNDSDLDLAIANGHVFDNVAYFRGAAGHAQQNLLFENDGNGKFVEVGRSSGPGFAVEKVSRALAVGDMDNDGDLDILVGNNGQAPDLLLNNGGNRKNSLLIRTVGSTANRDGVGARLRLKIGDKVLVREVKAGSSYASQNDLRVHFGLAGASTAERLEIAWPGGHIDVLEDIGGNQMITVLQGGRILSAKPFQRGR